jgi:hypothetical protein
VTDICKTWSIHRDNKLVGTVNLTWVDDGMGVRGGTFHPGPAYPSVRSVFQSFAAAENDSALCRQYYCDRDALGLTVADENGLPISAKVHIADFNTIIPDSDLEIELYPHDA